MVVRSEWEEKDFRRKVRDFRDAPSHTFKCENQSFNDPKLVSNKESSTVVTNSSDSIPEVSILPFKTLKAVRKSE